jgi:DNA-binding GntR family transcriptional regulator
MDVSVHSADGGVLGLPGAAEVWQRPPKLSQEVARRLRTMILTGHLPSGVRTTQQELARQLGVSTMPVREALLRLATEGFVEAIPNRSFTVVRTTSEDLRDVYRVHAILAGELARRACAKADDDFRQLLKARETSFRELLTGHDPAAQDACNWEFHRLINEAAESPKLMLMLRTTLRFIPSGFYELIPEWKQISGTGHQEILMAFLASDPDAASKAAASHVRAAGEVLLNHFPNSGYWAEPESKGTGSGTGPAPDGAPWPALDGIGD